MSGCRRQQSCILCTDCVCVPCRYLPQDSSLQSETVHFKRGVCQQFCLPSHTVNLSEWADEEVSKWNTGLHEAVHQLVHKGRYKCTVFLFSAALWRGQRGFPHGGAGCCRRGGWWVTVCLSHWWSDVKVELQNFKLRRLHCFLNPCRTSGPLSHTAGYIWKGKKDTFFYQRNCSRARTIYWQVPFQ